MKIQCRECGVVYDLPVTPEQVRRWVDGELVQRVFPELTGDQHELLISKTCGKCFDEMFAEPA